MGKRLWKSVEISLGFGMDRAAGGRPLQPAFCGVSGASQQPLRACSGCAGDYEDPDRTAWAPNPEEDDEAHWEDGGHESERASAREQAENDDEFPARGV